MTKNQINYLILTENQQKEVVANVECSKYVTKECFENERVNFYGFL